MKRFIAIALMAAMSLSMVACSNSGSSSKASGDAKVGVSVSASVEGEAEKATFGAVYAAVMVDSNGKIIACDIEETQIKPSIADGTVGEVDLRTKTEKQGDYGMAGASGIGKEWYEQAEAFEKYVVGKTAAEVRAIPVTDGKTTDADLAAGCTITVTGFIDAVASAAESASVTVGASDKLGLAVTSADASKEDSVAYNTEFCAVTVGSDGKVTSCQIDALQGKLPIVDGAFDIDSAKHTSKKQLGEDYGMRGSSAIGKEWFEQAAAFETYVTGKTADEVSKTAVTDGKASDADLSAGCTITVSSILANTEKAIAAAK